MTVWKNILHLFRSGVLNVLRHSRPALLSNVPFYDFPCNLGIRKAPATDFLADAYKHRFITRAFSAHDLPCAFIRPEQQNKLF